MIASAGQPLGLAYICKIAFIINGAQKVQPQLWRAFCYEIIQWHHWWSSSIRGITEESQHFQSTHHSFWWWPWKEQCSEEWPLFASTEWSDHEIWGCPFFLQAPTVTASADHVTSYIATNLTVQSLVRRLRTLFWHRRSVLSVHRQEQIDVHKRCKLHSQLCLVCPQEGENCSS